jgi:hypothetical protein
MCKLNIKYRNYLKAKNLRRLKNQVVLNEEV